jgi:predicted methyltransferase MtxX (methanogen marker protein 4)
MKLFKYITRNKAEAMIRVINDNREELTEAYKTIEKLKKDLDKVKAKPVKKTTTKKATK